MKTEIPTSLAAGIILLLIAVAAGIYFLRPQPAHQKPPGMPASVAKEFQKRMSAYGKNNGMAHP